MTSAERDSIERSNKDARIYAEKTLAYQKLKETTQVNEAEAADALALHQSEMQRKQTAEAKAARLHKEKMNIKESKLAKIKESATKADLEAEILKKERLATEAAEAKKEREHLSNMAAAELRLAQENAELEQKKIANQLKLAQDKAELERKLTQQKVAAEERKAELEERKLASEKKLAQDKADLERKVTKEKVAAEERKAQLEEQKRKREKQYATESANEKAALEERKIARELKLKKETAALELKSANEKAALEDRKNASELKLRREKAELEAQKLVKEREYAAEIAKEKEAVEKRKRESEQKCAREAAKLEAGKRESEEKYAAQRAERERKIVLDRAELKRKEIEARKPIPHKVWVGERQRIQIAIAEYEACRDNTGQALKDAEENIGEQTKTIIEYETKLVNAQQSVAEFNRAELLLKDTQEHNECKMKYDECKDEINAMIDKTCVNSEHMNYFLKLTQNIVPTVLKSVKQASDLNAEFKSFHELIDRQCCDQLSIDHYFATVGLSRFVPTLVMQDFLVMEDLECDDAPEFEEDVLEVLASAVTAAQSQWDKDKTTDDQAAQPPLAKKISRTEKKKLKKICCTGEKWQAAQSDKSGITKRDLLVLSPGMILFFESMDSSLKKALELLEFGSQLNNAQKQAMQEITAPESKVVIEELPSSTNDSNSNSNSNSVAPVVVLADDSTENDDDDDVKQMANGDSNSNSNTSNSDSSPLEMAVEKVEVNPLLVTEFTTATNQNNSFCESALRTIDVISTMEQDLKGNGKNFATTIQHTCEKIIKSQSNLRRNIAFAMEIAKLKPANIKGKAVETWKCVDDSCIKIYTSTIAVWEVSAEYFSFFSRFQQAFSRYVSSMEYNPECTFVVSLEFLKRDISAFLKFKDKYNKVMMALNQEAISCITDCVTQISGGKNYETATKNFDRVQQELFVQMEKLKQAEVAVDKKYHDLKVEESIHEAELAKARYLLKVSQEMIGNMNDSNAKANCDAEIVKLRIQLQTAVDYTIEWSNNYGKVEQGNGEEKNNVKNRNVKDDKVVGDADADDSKLEPEQRNTGGGDNKAKPAKKNETAAEQSNTGGGENKDSEQGNADDSKVGDENTEQGNVEVGQGNGEPVPNVPLSS